MSSVPPLARRGALTLAEQVAGAVAGFVADRTLLPGARVPSVREASRRFGVSPATIVAAYDRLQAQGVLEARAQRGFYVRGPHDAGGGASRTAGAGADRRAARSGSSIPSGARATHGPVRSAVAADGDRHRRAPGSADPILAPLHATALIRGMFRATADRHSPGIGTLPAEWLDAPLLQRALRAVTDAGSAAQWLGYGPPHGDPALREAAAARNRALGFDASADQVITTVGASHALDVTARTLLRPGDAVLVDEPGWAVEFARLDQLGVRILTVPRGEDGPDIDVMQRMLERERPRVYITVSVLHNPTGTSLSPARAHQVLRLAEAHDLTIVEDDSYGWLAPPHAVRLAALDGLRRTLLVTGVSKILTPAWRVGWVTAPVDLVERLIDVKLLSTLSSPTPLEQAVAWCLQRGLLRRHAERIVERLDGARSRVHRLAEEAGCRFVSPPRGLFGWLDVGMDTQALALRAAQEGWQLAPGHLFYAHRQACTRMRVNFATAQDARLWRRLAQWRADAG